MSGIGFEPQGVYLLIQVPKEYYIKQAESGIILNDATKASKRKEYIEGGDKMLVAAIGSDCRFANVGDYVSVSIRGAMEIELDDIDEPFLVIRENEIIGKFD